jgi:hypothetical protein
MRNAPLNKVDDFEKIPNFCFIVIPAKAGIQYFRVVIPIWIPAFAGMTDFLRVHQGCYT